MGVPMIPGAERGVYQLWAWNWRIIGTKIRYGALVSTSIRNGAQERDVVANSDTGSGKLIGFVNTFPGGLGQKLTTFFTQDEVGVDGVGVVQLGHVECILAPNQTLAIGDDLIPELAPPVGIAGRVQARPPGSTVAAVAKALQNVSSTNAELLIQADALLPGNAAGDGGQIIMAEGRDAVVTARYLGGPGSTHINPAAAAQTPVIYRAQADGEVLSAFKVQVDVAAGGAKVISYELAKGATAAAANAAAALLTLTITDPAVSAENNADTITLAKGEVLVARTVSADPGTAVHSYLQFRKG